MYLNESFTWFTRNFTKYKKERSKGLTITHQAIDDSKFEKISRAAIAHQAWKILENKYKGVDRVKKVHLKK